MMGFCDPKTDRGVTPVVGVIVVVAVTVILASIAGAYFIGLTDDIGETPSFTALELDFEEEPVPGEEYEDLQWDIEVTHTGGEDVAAEDIVVHLDHGDQRITGDINRSMRSGDTVELEVVHNNQEGTTFSEEKCEKVSVACRLAGNDGNYPDDEEVELRMIHEPSDTVLYEEDIEISAEYGIYNGESNPEITDETLTFA